MSDMEPDKWARMRALKLTGRRAPGWPQHVHSVGLETLSFLGTDAADNLYWDGKRVEVRPFSLTFWQKVGAVTVTVSALAAAIGAVSSALADWRTLPSATAINFLNDGWQFLTGNFAATMFGALVGATASIYGGKAAARLTQAHQREALQAALRAELEVTHRIFAENDTEQFYRNILHEWVSTGTVTLAELLLKTLDFDPSQNFPVYYATIGSIGMLPDDLQEKLIDYHANYTAMMKLVRFALSDRDKLKPEAFQSIGQNVEDMFNTMVAGRAQLIGALQAGRANR